MLCAGDTKEGWKHKDVERKECRYKFLWQGCPEEIHGVGVLVSDKFVNKVVEVKRMRKRLMMVKLVIGKCPINVISGYTPQVGRSQFQKDIFWNAV